MNYTVDFLFLGSSAYCAVYCTANLYPLANVQRLPGNLISHY